VSVSAWPAMLSVNQVRSESILGGAQGEQLVGLAELVGEVVRSEEVTGQGAISRGRVISMSTYSSPATAASRAVRRPRWRAKAGRVTSF
jgi:hypothetical protein